MNLRDEIARRAARRLAQGAARTLPEAIREAAAELRADPRQWPGESLVRRHAQAMAQETLGSAGYAGMVELRLRMAEEIMSLLAIAEPEAVLWLVGRAARGQVDADPHLGIRYMGTASIGELARILVDGGCEEPAFEVIQTRWGRLERLRIREASVQCTVTRCPPQQVRQPELDLFSGRPIARLSLAQLRKRLALPPG